jgi:hypothetical protein
MREPKSIVLARAAISNGAALLGTTLPLRSSGRAVVISQPERTALHAKIVVLQLLVSEYINRNDGPRWSHEFARICPHAALAKIRVLAREIDAMVSDIVWCAEDEHLLSGAQDCATCEWCESTHPIDNLTVLGDSEHSIYCCDACRTKNAAFCG